MAIKKEKQTVYGITANYWRVDTLSIDKVRKEGGFTLNLYTSEDAESPVDAYIVSFTGDKYAEPESTERFDKYFGIGSSNYTNIYQACYQCAKETEEFFKDAVDC